MNKNGKVQRIHNHPKMEETLGVDKDHVIIDKDTFEEILRIWDDVVGKILNKYMVKTPVRKPKELRYSSITRGELIEKLELLSKKNKDILLVTPLGIRGERGDYLIVCQ